MNERESTYYTPNEVWDFIWQFKFFKNDSILKVKDFVLANSPFNSGRN